MPRKKNNLLKTILLIVILLLILLCAGLAITYFQNLQTYEQLPSENGTISICFTKQENCTRRLLPILQNARQVMAALYELNDPAIIDTLKRKEADLAIDEDGYSGLGKKIVTPGLMHDKFYVISDLGGKDYVVTGSTNPTRNDLYKNDNNMVIISSRLLKENYENEFFEIKDSGENEKTRFTKISFNGFIIENYFCPDDGCEEKVLSTIQSAKSSVYFMVFSFTSDAIGNYLVTKKGTLDVRGVFDKSQVASNGEYSEYPRMKMSDMDVKTENSTGKLHHKVFIIDNDTVITGSYNPTYSGDKKNDENILIIHNKEIAEEYLREFERIWTLC
jgi:phosphatidylserine/phosphatidylglycerophosphate/cardiolipin synthase-like enzyme